ncbi:MAG: DUF2206 domain-containing protein [Dehalococcoidia bacterium]
MLPNPLLMNDWNIRSFLRAFIALQAALLVLVLLSAIGIDIYPLRYLVGFIYLAFIPGIIILRILKMHQLGQVRTVLYAVGLSLAFNMFLGLIENILLPLVGIARPLSTIPLFIVWTVILGLLCFICYKRDRAFSSQCQISLSSLFTAPVLLFTLLPLLAILGTQLVNNFGNSTLLLVAIGLIGAAFILLLIKKGIPESVFPLAIFSISLTLLWHQSLFSNYLTGYDIFTEFYFLSLALKAGFWDWTINHTYNAMMSVTILPAVYSQILKIDGAEIFKAIYPIWYSLVPVGLYEIYRKFFDSRQALCGVLLFVSMFVFYSMMPSVTRQMIAELFFVLLLLLITGREATSSQKSLFIIFGAGLVVSHYSLSYMFIAYLLVTSVILLLFKKRNAYIAPYTIILIIVICLAWYIYTSGAAPIVALANVGNRLLSNLNLELLNPFSRDVFTVGSGPAQDIFHSIYRIFWYLTLFLIALGGALWFIRDFRQRKGPKEYFTIAAASYALLGACIVIPFFSEQLGRDRMIHIALFGVAPFLVIAWENIVAFSARFFKNAGQASLYVISNILIGISLILFLFFNTGFIFELSYSQVPTSLPLSASSFDAPDRQVPSSYRVLFRSIWPSEQEIHSAQWLGVSRNTTQNIYATLDDIRVPSLSGYGMVPEGSTTAILPPSKSDQIESGYIYTGYVNNLYGYGMTNPSFLKVRPKDPFEVAIWDFPDISSKIKNSDLIYTNKTSVIYLAK